MKPTKTDQKRPKVTWKRPFPFAIRKGQFADTSAGNGRGGKHVAENDTGDAWMSKSALGEAFRKTPRSGMSDLPTTHTITEQM